MYIQSDYDSQPEFFPDPPEVDFDEWREKRENIWPEPSTADDLPF